MARISLTPPRRVLLQLAERYARHTYGRTLEPLQAMGHHVGVLAATAGYELAASRWHRLKPTLAHLALTASAARVGCAWCLDFAYWIHQAKGVPADKLRDIVDWRDSDAYDEVERLVLAYAEAMSDTPPAVTDELVVELRRHLDDPQLVELTQLIALENARARFNDALGLQRQGFSDSCEVAAPQREPTA